jgi:capsular polysaccharide biosynthesis protein
MNTAPEFYRALWRHRYRILVLTLIATTIAYIQSSGEAKVYRASTLIRVEQRSASNDPQQLGDALGVAQHLAQTYAQIVSTNAVGDRVYDYLGHRGPRSEINITGEPVQDLELMYIHTTSHLPQVAAAAANATPVVLRTFIASTGGPKDTIVTINPADVPSTAISPRPLRTAVLALLVAFVFNCGVALLFEFLRDRLPESDALEEALGKPVLASVPKLSLTQGSVTRRGATAISGRATAQSRAAKENA